MSENNKRLTGSKKANSLVFTIIGVVLLLMPGATINLVCNILGGALVLAGAIGLFGGMSVKALAGGQIKIGVSIVLIIAGIFIMTKSDFVASIIPFVAGIIILVHGINNLRQSFGMQKIKDNKWTLGVIIGIICVIFGIVLVLNPFSAVITLIRAIGLFLAIDGGTNLWLESHISASEIKSDIHETIDVEGKFVD